MESLETISLACGVFILLDIATGVVGAVKNNELSSAVMREGLFNKVGELFLLALGMACYWILTIDPFNEIGIQPEIMGAVAVYIIGMELVSVIENICKINPELPVSKIFMIFNVDAGHVDDVQSNQEQTK